MCVPIWKINNGGLNGGKRTVEENAAAQWTAAGINYMVCMFTRLPSCGGGVDVYRYGAYGRLGVRVGRVNGMRRVGANDVLMLLPRPSRPISVETTYILFIGLANLRLRNTHAFGTTRNPPAPLSRLQITTIEQQLNRTVVAVLTKTFFAKNPQFSFFFRPSIAQFQYFLCPLPSNISRRFSLASVSIPVHVI